ncbi:MAG TPA: ATPase domain-containing protein [Thermoplasmata archaeon]|nr:ATPase domain-containing protein [Thermoplasmata archaeon]
MSDAQRIFDIPELDQPLAPALRPGWLAVLSGTSGSGAPLLAKQFANAGVGSSPVLFYTTYERTDDVRGAFEDFGWDPADIKIVNLADEYYERVLVRGLEVARVRERGLSLEDLARPEAEGRGRAAFSLTDRMLADLATIDAPFRLVVDSVDFFFEVLEPRDVITVARQIRHRCQTIGGQALIAVHSASHERTTTTRLEDLADLVVTLRAEARGDRHAHTLSVEKVGNRPDLTRIWRARLEERGWRVDAPPSPG